MAQQVTYHVMPGEHGSWNVTEESSGSVVSSHRTRIEAILRGRDLAKGQEYSLLVVHDREGRYESQYTYGRQPRPSPAKDSGQ